MKDLQIIILPGLLFYAHTIFLHITFETDLYFHECNRLCPKSSLSINLFLHRSFVHMRVAFNNVVLKLKFNKLNQTKLFCAQSFSGLNNLKMRYSNNIGKIQGSICTINKLQVVQVK